MKWKKIAAAWTPESIKIFFDVLITKSKHHPREVNTVSVMKDLLTLLEEDISKDFKITPPPKDFKYTIKRNERESIMYSVRCTPEVLELSKALYHTLYINKKVRNFYTIIDMGIALLEKDCIEKYEEIIENTVDLPIKYVRYIEQKNS